MHIALKSRTLQHLVEHVEYHRQMLSLRGIVDLSA